MIESPALARGLADALDRAHPLGAYEVRLAGTRMQWVERRGNTNTVHDAEPKTGLWRRIAVTVSSGLPIEPLL